METVKNIDQLKVPVSIQKELNEFINHIIQLYTRDLISIMAFGSCVTGDYIENKSDVNIMIVYSDLNITDLNAVAKLSRVWLKKRAFSPRFVTLGNLKDSSAFYQIDMLEMKDMHVTLFGKDLFTEININKQGIHWQLSYEIKGMRMRIKQQFWRSCDNEQLMLKILMERFTSIIHLSRALLFIYDKAIPKSYNEILGKMKEEFGIPSEFVLKMQLIKEKSLKPDEDVLVKLFAQLMEIIKMIDNKTDMVKFDHSKNSNF
jgi:predicted nucleotidyltransferase